MFILLTITALPVFALETIPICPNGLTFKKISIYNPQTQSKMEFYCKDPERREWTLENGEEKITATVFENIDPDTGKSIFTFNTFNKYQNGSLVKYFKLDPKGEYERIEIYDSLKRKTFEYIKGAKILEEISYDTENAAPITKRKCFYDNDLDTLVEFTFENQIESRVEYSVVAKVEKENTTSENPPIENNNVEIETENIEYIAEVNTTFKMMDLELINGPSEIIVTKQMYSTGHCIKNNFFLPILKGDIKFNNKIYHLKEEGIKKDELTNLLSKKDLLAIDLALIEASSSTETLNESPVITPTETPTSPSEISTEEGNINPIIPNSTPTANPSVEDSGGNSTGNNQ